mgnify:CR=1 FL=1
MSNAIASLSMQLGLDTRQFTEGVTATQRELKLLRKVMEDTKTPQEELQQQLDGIQRIREKFTTVPEAKWEAAIEKIKQRYWEVNAIQAEVVDESARIPTPSKMVGADALGFAASQLTSRFGILGRDTKRRRRRWPVGRRNHRFARRCYGGCHCCGQGHRANRDDDARRY